MKKKTIELTIRLSCGAGHRWAPCTVPLLIGNPNDSTIIRKDFTRPVARDIDLRELEKCPGCGDVANVIHVEVAPGEM
jgi:hypothetical protein